MIQTTRTELTNRRKAKGLSALDLALDAGTSEMRIYAIERGRCTPGRDEAEALARALGMKSETLFPDVFKAADR